MRARTFGRLIIACATLGAMLVLGGATLAAPAAVSIQSSAFVPQAVTVNVGETVTWTNRDFSQHTATAAGVFNTGVLSQDQSRSIVMTSAGTFQYRCEIHTFMTGTVTVIATATATPAPTPPPTAPPTPPPATAPPPPPTAAPTPVRTPTPATPAPTPTPPPATIAPTASPTTSPTPVPTADPPASPSAVAQSSPSPRSDPPAPGTAPVGTADTGPGPTLAIVAAVIALSLVGAGVYWTRRR